MHLKTTQKKGKEYWVENWDGTGKEYLESMLENKQKHIQIVGLFALLKGYKFENYDQVIFFIKRFIASAERLTPFDIDKIKNTLKYLIETADYKITLETVEKYILEDLDELRGDKPIITLKNGEQIYKSSEIETLEQQGKIAYRDEAGGKWEEVS